MSVVNLPNCFELFVFGFAFVIDISTENKTYFYLIDFWNIVTSNHHISLNDIRMEI